ncbi:MAG: hypothetical protein HFI82_00600 [Eubacterium sp.]|nr:hypothetical protein [Eubacterium sp.]
MRSRTEEGVCACALYRDLEILNHPIQNQQCLAMDGKASHNAHGCAFVTVAYVPDTPPG